MYSNTFGFRARFEPQIEKLKRLYNDSTTNRKFQSKATQTVNKRYKY